MGGRCCGEAQELDPRRRGPIPPGVTRPDDRHLPRPPQVPCRVSQEPPGARGPVWVMEEDQAESSTWTRRPSSASTTTAAEGTSGCGQRGGPQPLHDRYRADVRTRGGVQGV